MGGTLAELFVVATPIGNLRDLTERARKTLSEVELIAAEDTRRTRNLLNACDITTQVIPCHDHNEESATKAIIAAIRQGKSVALVSDAGTPLISDPGFHLIKTCLEANIIVVPIPGPSAVTAALSVSGIAMRRFSFEGFLPSKAKARKELLGSLAKESRTMVFFETPHRIAACLDDMVETFGHDRMTTLCRELTKSFEQVVRAELADIAQSVHDGSVPAKGEFVLVVAGADPEPDFNADQLIAELVQNLPPNRVAAIAAKLTGIPRKKAYERALALKGSGDGVPDADDEPER